MRTIAAFIRLSRLKFLTGGFAGFALGAAVAAYEGHLLAPGAYALGQLMVTSFHLMTHYSNEFFDLAGDARTLRTAFSGGSGVLVRGELPPRAALVAALACAAAGLATAAVFAAHANRVAAAVGLAIAVLAWSYSAPPLRLAGKGLGEIDTALVVAVLVPLAGYAAFSRSIDLRAITATGAPACAMLAMMIAVEWPDVEADAATGKRNLVVRFGKRATRRWAQAAALASLGAFPVAWLLGAPPSFAFAGLLVAPAALAFARRIGDERARPAAVAAAGVTVSLMSVCGAAMGYVIAVLR